MKQWHIIGRHNHRVEGAKITESLFLDNSGIRRFTTTIDGWGNFHIRAGNTTGMNAEKRVNFIRSKEKTE